MLHLSDGIYKFALPKFSQDTGAGPYFHADISQQSIRVSDDKVPTKSLEKQYKRN